MCYSNRRTFFYVLGIIAIHFAIFPTMAIGKTYAVKSAGKVAPFIDNLTVAIVRMNLKEISPELFSENMTALSPEMKPYLPKIAALFSKRFKYLKEAGCKEIYYIYSISDKPSIDNHIFAVLPLQKRSDIGALSHAIKKTCPSIFIETKQIGNSLVAGSPTTIKHLKAFRPDHRPELKTALQSAGNADLAIMLLPPHYLRRVIDETMPILPDKIGGGSSEGLSDGFLWATVCVYASPKTSVQLLIKSQDKQSAQKLSVLWRRIYEAIIANAKDGKGPLYETGSAAECMRNLFETLTPRVKGDRLVLNLNSDGNNKSSLSVAIKQAIYAIEHIATAYKFTKIIKLMHKYHELHNTFPAPAICDKDGKPLLSWRVSLLCYTEHDSLYSKFKLDEPWDSPHNIKLLSSTPDIYLRPGCDGSKGMTTFLLSVGKNMAFEKNKELGTKDIDYLFGTIMMVDAANDHAVPWTKPVDFEYNPHNPADGLGNTNDFIAVFCDGYIKIISKKSHPQKLHKMFDRSK